MAKRLGAYSTFVAALKVALPLIALVLLSTLFLFSKSNEPLEDLPISTHQSSSENSGETVSGPIYTGLSSKGDVVRMNADIARPLEDGGTETENMWARLETSETEYITVTSATAEVNSDSDEAILTGRVRIESSDGYILNTEQMNTRLDKIEAETAGEVFGHGPLGTLEAGKMVVWTKENDEDVELLFTGGVKLVYTPKKQESDGQ